MSTLSLYRIDGVQLDDVDLKTKIFTKTPVIQEVSVRPTDLRLFFIQGPQRRPDWAAYLEKISPTSLPVSSRTTEGAILLIATAASDHLHAATWGTGHYALKAEMIHPDLGLRCALNLVAETQQNVPWSPERMRAVQTKRFGRSTLITEMQSSRKGSFDDFPISYTADQLRRITASPTDAVTWGQSVTGGTSLTVRSPDSPSELPALCTRVDSVHSSTAYKRHFAWTDNISAIRNEELLHRAGEKIFLRTSGPTASVVDFAPPTLVKWEEIDRFEFRLGRQRMEFDDPSDEALRQCVDEISTPADFSGDGWNIKVAAINADGKIDSGFTHASKTSPLAFYDGICRTGLQPIVHRVGRKVDLARPGHGTVFDTYPIEEVHIAKRNEDTGIVAVDEIRVVESTARPIGKLDVQLETWEGPYRDYSPFHRSRYARGGIFIGGLIVSHSVQFSIREPRFTAAHSATSFAAVRGNDP